MPRPEAACKVLAPPGEMERREAHQQPLERKLMVAEFVVDNNADRRSVRSQIERILSKFKPSGV